MLGELCCPKTALNSLLSVHKNFQISPSWSYFLTWRGGCRISSRPRESRIFHFSNIRKRQEGRLNLIYLPFFFFFFSHEALVVRVQLTLALAKEGFKWPWPDAWWCIWSQLRSRCGTTRQRLSVGPYAIAIWPYHSNLKKIYCTCERNLLEKTTIMNRYHNG